MIWVNVADARLVLPAWWRRCTAWTATLVAVVTVVLAEQGIPVPHETLLALASALLLALIVLPQAQESASDSSVLCRLLRVRSFAAAGAASYSLFLWHEPVVRWLNGQGLTFDGPGGFWINLALVGTVSGVLSGLTYRWVEQPSLRRKSLPARGADSLRRPAVVPVEASSWAG